MDVENSNITFKVSFLKTDVRINKAGKVTSYRLRWVVDGQEFKKSFKRSAQANSHLSLLMSAAKKGEAFDKLTGEPISWAESREEKDDQDERPQMSWYEFCCSYTDAKWQDSSGNHRAAIGYLLSLITPVMLADVDCPYTALDVRTALRRYGFNTKNRPEAPAEVKAILAWVERNTESMSRLERPEMARLLLNAAISKTDGSRAAASTGRRHHSMLMTAMKHAIELGVLTTDPIQALKWEPPSLRGLSQVDRRAVVNPHQAERLLNAIEARKPSGPYLKPFFAALYYCGLRPEEAVEVTKDDRYLPDGDDEWGEFYLKEAAPDVGRDWTDSGEIRDHRGLKHRPKGVMRTVPIPPPCVKILRQHEKGHGFGPDGRLFFGVRGGVLHTSTILRVWGWAREDGLTAEEAASPLAERPYDLRHACISTWLNAGISFVQAAEWAGNSPSVLEHVYAKCLVGQRTIDQAKILSVLTSAEWRTTK